MGNQWIKTSGTGAQGATGSGGGSSTPAAPNVTSATCAVSFVSDGHDQTTIFSGTFSFNTSDPNYSHDVRVDVFAIDASGNMVLVATRTGAPLGSPTSYSGSIGTQPDATQTWSVKFVCLNEAGSPTAGPYAITGVSVTGTTANVTAVSGVEVGPVYQDSNQGLHTIVSLTPTVSHAPVYVTLWLDFADGNGPQNQGTYPIASPGQSVEIGQQSASTTGITAAGGIWVPTDPTHGTWTVYAFPGDVTGNAVPGGAVSATFAVAVAQSCLPTDCSNIQFVENPVTSDLINYVLGGNGQYNWTFNELDWLQPTAAEDPYYQYSMVTVQKGYAQTGTGTVSSGVDLHDATASFVPGQAGFQIHINGDWNIIAGVTDGQHLVLTTSVANGSVSYEIWNQAPDWEGVNADPDLLWYGRGPIATSGDPSGGPELLGSTVQIFGDSPPDWSFPPVSNPDGSTNLYRTYRFLNYAVSRLGQNPNGGPQTGTYTLQTGWPGGADHFDLTVAVQPSALDLSQATGASTGPGLHVTSGTLAAKLTTPLTFLSDQITIATQGVTNTYLGSAAADARVLAANSVTAANAALAADSVVDSNVASVGVPKLISGTVVFTGTVVLSQGSANPVIVLQNTGLFLYSSAASGGGSGLTTQPFVAVQNTGIGIFSGGNPSVTVNSGSVNLWSVNGNTANPFLSLASGGLTITSGSFTAVVQAAQIKLSFSTTVSATLTSAGLTISNGSYSTTVGSTSIVLTNGTNSVTINSSSVSIVNGTLSLVQGGTTTLIQNTSLAGVVSSLVSYTTSTGDGLVIIAPGNVGIYSFFSSPSLRVLLGGSSGVAGFLSLYDNSGAAQINISPTGGVRIFNGSGVALSASGLFTTTDGTNTTTVGPTSVTLSAVGNRVLISGASGVAGSIHLCDVSGATQVAISTSAGLQIFSGANVTLSSGGEFTTTNGTSSVILGPNGFSNVGTGVGFNGTVSTSGGTKNVVGGIIQN